jgi:V-type H+-transporting ATPase subunit d
MIDNIVLLLQGTIHQRPIAELISKCHPLGSFEQMEAIHVAGTPAELYNAVLVDTPLANYFTGCISEEDLDEMNIEIIRNTLYKSYIEDFYAFCEKLGGDTGEIMCKLLSFEADRRHVFCSFIENTLIIPVDHRCEDRKKVGESRGKIGVIR